MLFLRGNGTCLKLSPYAWIAAGSVFAVGFWATVDYDRKLDLKNRTALLHWLSQGRKRTSHEEATGSYERA